MELWRRVFHGSKEAKQRISLNDRFLRMEWADKQEIPQEIPSGLDYGETQKTVNTRKISEKLIV